MLKALRDKINEWQEKSDQQKKDSSNVARYREAVRLSLLDWELSNAELTTLQTLASSLNIPRELQNQVHAEAWAHLNGALLNQEDLSPQHVLELNAIGHSLGQSDQTLPPDLQRQKYIAGVLLNMEQGYLPTVAPEGLPLIKLTKGETLHAATRASLLQEKSTGSFRGISHGFSIPIGRRLRYRPSFHTGRFLPQTEIVVSDTGVLCFTSKRISFIGGKRNFSFLWNKVLAIHPYSDGMGVSAQNRVNTIVVRFENQPYPEIVHATAAYFLQRAE